jgi:hypothetical protein
LLFLNNSGEGDDQNWRNGSDEGEGTGSDEGEADGSGGTLNITKSGEVDVYQLIKPLLYRWIIWFLYIHILTLILLLALWIEPLFCK